jgi:lipoprotein-releasing system ATP-binding protein
MATLCAYNVKKTYIQGTNTINVLQGITASFEQGTSYAITGPSGSGKSTLMHLLAGLDTPTQGAISFNGIDIHSFAPAEKKALLANSLGLVFQLPYLISEFSVLENVMLKGMIAGGHVQDLKEQAYVLLEQVHLAHKAHSNPLSLSGGEQQRVALARALFNKPAFLLADEPTGNLDVATGKVIVELLVSCQAQWGMGLIISSHDAYVCERMVHVLHLDNGILK